MMPVQCVHLLNLHHHGLGGLQEGSHKGTGTNIIRASDHGFNDAHVNLGNIYYYEGDLKKAKHHYMWQRLWLMQ